MLSYTLHRIRNFMFCLLQMFVFEMCCSQDTTRTLHIHSHNVRSKFDRVTDFFPCFQIFLKYGIEPNFWDVVGDQNPLLTSEFHALSLVKKAWILKALCTTIFVNIPHYIFKFRYTFILNLFCLPKLLFFFYICIAF